MLKKVRECSAPPTVREGEFGVSIAWQSGSGEYLAVPDREGRVQLYDRSTGNMEDEKDCLKGVHTGPVAQVAWSPNGLYAATAGTDGQVVVWKCGKDNGDMSCQDLSSYKVAAQVCALMWRPCGNALAYADVEGGVEIWEDPVPSHWASPSEGAQKSGGIDRSVVAAFDSESPLEDLFPPPIPTTIPFADLYANKAANAPRRRVNSTNAHSGDEGDDIAEEDTPHFNGSKPGMAWPSRPANRNPNRATGGATPLATGGHEREESGLGENRAGRAEADLGERTRDRTNEGRERLGRDGEDGVDKWDPFAAETVQAESALPMQTAFQPNATESLPGKQRFLAYNLMGCITSREDGEVSRVETEFHDTSLGMRVPPMTDYYGFTMAAFGERGSVYASPRRDDKNPSTVLYRPFNSWATNSEWTMRCKGDESVVSVALGHRWVAACTSHDLVRVISDSGIQINVYDTEGPVLTCVGHNHLLAVVTHLAAPLPSGQQVLEFVITDVRERKKVGSHRLKLSAGATLQWLGFSDQGVLCSFDSNGILRGFMIDNGGTWVPLWSSASLKKSRREEDDAEADGASEEDWPWVVGVSEDKVYAVVCKAAEIEPQVTPKPVLSVHDLQMPIMASDLPAAPLEEDLLLTMKMHFQSRTLADEAYERGTPDDEEDNRVTKLESAMDRALLRLIAAACKANKVVRAFELATMLTSVRLLEGAVKLATTLQHMALAERLNLLLEDKHRQKELEDAAAAQPTESTWQPDSSTHSLEPHWPSDATTANVPNGESQANTSVIGSRQSYPMAKPPAVHVSKSTASGNPHANPYADPCNQVPKGTPYSAPAAIQRGVNLATNPDSDSMGGSMGQAEVSMPAQSRPWTGGLGRGPVSDKTTTVVPLKDGASVERSDGKGPAVGGSGNAANLFAKPSNSPFAKPSNNPFAKRVQADAGNGGGEQGPTAYSSSLFATLKNVQKQQQEEERVEASGVKRKGGSANGASDALALLRAGKATKK
eukprot:TRINITY_DN521_c0_g1_i2.p1 TRINITY_DN521_c0_g1~~TRINITY_DN521_c0_g1_i2.p1  ORF type:complete len:998 (+),score=196.36 TRINITY_DN521_c0_g1_i2:1944-4937(+)